MTILRSVKSVDYVLGRGVVEMRKHSSVTGFVSAMDRKKRRRLESYWIREVAAGE